MSFQQTDTEDSASSLSEVSSLDDHFDAMQLEIGSSNEEVSDDDMDSQAWNEIESESDEEFHGLIEEGTSISEDNTINPIDCYRHFITDEIIDLMVRETNRYAQQYLQNHETSRRSICHQWKPTTNEEMLKFFGIIIEMGLVQMPKLKYYWSSSQLYGSEALWKFANLEFGQQYIRHWRNFPTTFANWRISGMKFANKYLFLP